MVGSEVAYNSLLQLLVLTLPLCSALLRLTTRNALSFEIIATIFIFLGKIRYLSIKTLYTLV